MSTTRQQAREAVATLLSGLGTYQLVSEGARRTFSQVSPVAVVLSRGLRPIQLTRDTHDEHDLLLSATIYVRCDQSVDGTTEAAAEDTLDTLVTAAEIALRAAGYLIDGATDAAPDGAPLRDIQGVLYRVERIPIVLETYV